MNQSSTKITSTYVEPSLISYYADVANFLIILIIILYFKEKKIVSIKLFYYLILSLLACFVFNFIIFEWTYFPDQNRYFQITAKIRDQLHNFDIKASTGSSYQFYTSLSLSLIPLPFIETINSLSFFNKLIFILFIVFAYNKKIIKDENLILFIFFPSILLYSSLSLKDNVIFVLSLWTIYSIINRDSLRAILLICLLIAVKVLSGLLFLIFFIAYKILFSETGRKTSFLFNIIIMSLFVLIMLQIYKVPVLEKINIHMFNF